MRVLLTVLALWTLALGAAAQQQPVTPQGPSNDPLALLEQHVAALRKISPYWDDEKNAPRQDTGNI